ILYIILISIIALTTSYAQNKKPNIIFLLSDDQKDNTFSAMGHPYIKSPNVDQLIKNGVRFSNTYVAEPICAPSRVAFFTGLNERMSGVGFTSSYKLTEEQWANTYPELLRNNGYYTGFIGKFGIEYYTFKGKTNSKFDYWRAHDGWAKFWPKTAKNCSEYFDSGEDIITPVMGESIVEFLDQAPSEKPFCLSVSFSVPHGSQIKSMYPGNKDAADCMIPANEYEKLKGHPFYDTLYRNLNIEIPKETATDPYVYIPKNVLDQNKGRASNVYKYDYNPISCKEHHIRYYQQISGMDKVIGDLVAALKEKGLTENTIIIFASDHGLLMGEYGMGGKALLYDLAAKVPCFIYDPRLPEEVKGTTIDNLVSSLDIPSTILDYAGISKPEYMQGSSLIPLLNGESKKWRKELFLESLYTGRDNPICEGIVDGKWKYIRMFQIQKRKYSEKDLDFDNLKPDFEQLFNLQEDPMETNNLVSVYENTSLLKKLRKKTGRYSSQLNRQRESYKSDTHTVAR
ncbi:sulfatase-like hydrolase/transferase, partial [Saccharicrinis fermentans]|uniref:sulfatase-like hydrolase/transferase n=1 Tax=Saccharicrinis fermentans TaxID=982 RepID=UPI0005C442B6